MLEYLSFSELVDKIVSIGSSTSLRFDVSCLGALQRFARFQWFHKDSTAKIEKNVASRYTLRKRDTELVISNVSTKQLGKYAVRIHVDTYGPYEMSARVDLKEAVGRCSKIFFSKSKKMSYISSL